MYQLCQYQLWTLLYTCMTSNWYFGLVIIGFPTDDVIGTPSKMSLEEIPSLTIISFVPIPILVGVVFNPQKMHVKAPAINFFGCLYNANGVHPEPEKGDAVHALPAPKNVTELQEFLSMVTYLSPFLHGLSTLIAPLQGLLRKDADFTWNASYEAVFKWVKEAVISETTLRYFNPSLPVTIQVDASQVGLGATLLQNNKPIAFASKALTDAECRYAKIEREMLAIVFRAEQFLHLHLWMVLQDQIRP